MPLLIAHRGDTIYYPENTLEAFLSAFEKGADGIELDVHLLDDEVIVVHNFLFDQKKVHPTLERILDSIHSKGRIDIEIKAFSPDILQPLKMVLDKFPTADLELTTSEIPLCPHMKKVFPQTPSGIIFKDVLFENWMTQELVQQKLIGWGNMANADRLHISPKTLSQFGEKNLVDQLHSAGFLVHSHIYNTETQTDDHATISEWGVDQCTFDNIDILNSRKALHP